MSGVGRLVGSLRQSRSQSLSPLSSLTNFVVSQSIAQAEPVLLRARQLTTGSSSTFSPVHIEDEPYCRQRQLIALGNRVSGVGCRTDAPCSAAPAYALKCCRIRQKCWRKLRFCIALQIPVVSPDTWVAPNAVVVGDVDLFDRVSQPSYFLIAVCQLRIDSLLIARQVSVWYGCVLRGDLNSIRIGAFSNVQDKTVMHAAR